MTRPNVDPAGTDSRYDRGVAKKQRLDVVITERGLAPSRARAQALILAGKVRLDGVVETKAGTQVDLEAAIEIINSSATAVAAVTVSSGFRLQSRQARSTRPIGRAKIGRSVR